MKKRLFTTKKEKAVPGSVISLIAGNVFLIAALIVIVWLITLITQT